MPAQLKYVDPNCPRSLFSRAYAAFSGARPGTIVQLTGRKPDAVA